MWCQLSDKAWDMAHKKRLVRAKRMWKDKVYLTTEEKREINE